MPNKYNNNSEYFKDWSTKKLKQEALNYDEMIYKVESYGTKDIHNFIGICSELEKRGIKIHNGIAFD